MAKNIGFAVANSPLFKTAIAGEDPNWGRIVMAIGKSEENIVVNKIKIKIGEYLVTENGQVSNEYNESNLKEYMKWDSIKVQIDLGLGNASFTVYTCDFTNDYIDINADYRN
jgi:glutamate N-acetyltransferase/amino-acid N-acetyltransferase